MGDITMKTDYSDILKRLGEPLWWDENGVPRYEPFSPELCRPYTKYVALLLISCQDCGRRYKVAVSYNDMRISEIEQLGYKFELPTKESPGFFEYGDPPFHLDDDCWAGYCMLSNTLQILEFWERKETEWVRRSEYEYSYV